MTVEDPPGYLQSDSHSAKVFRHVLAAIFGQPVASHTPTATVTTGGGGNGVCDAGDLVVSANGTPNMSVNVAAGGAVIRGSEAATQGPYTFYNDATVNLAIGTANGSNPRDDIIVAQVRDAGGGYSGSSNDARLFVVAGTAAASPADPTLPVNCIALARVRVGTGVTSIVGGNITDLRRRAYTVGGRVVCTSSTRPSGAAVYEGMECYETDTDRIIIYDGLGWLGWDCGDWTTYTPTLTNLTLGNGTRLARWKRRGREADVMFSFVMGSTSAMGAAPTFSLPATAVDPHDQVAGFVPVARGSILDLGTTLFDAAGFLVSTTTIGIQVWKLDLGWSRQDGLSATNPMTWATGDRIHLGPFPITLFSPYV